MNLIIFTQDYPYGRGEPFLESEILFASNFFDDVFIMSSSRNHELFRELPDNVHPHKVDKSYRFVTCLAYALLKLFSKEARDEWKFLHQSEIKFNSNQIIKSWIIYWMLEKRYSLYTSKLNLPKDDTVAYAYWMDSRAYFIAKHRHLWCWAVSRAHRYEVQETIYIPFRREIEKGLDRIYFISELARDAHRKLLELEKTPNNDIKHRISRLGVCPQEKMTHLKDETFHIVSCSTINHNKRLDLIIQTIQRLSRNHCIKWTHIGWGSDGDNVVDYAKKVLSTSSVRFCFTGALSNKDVLDFYRQNHVDLFLNLSDIEGVPVSIMEAMSFGIPAVARDVGWNSDVVVPGLTGYLLPKEVTANEVAEMIDNIIKRRHNTKIQPENVMKFIADKYSIESNYSAFYQGIIQDAKQFNDKHF